MSVPPAVTERSRWRRFFQIGATVTIVGLVFVLTADSHHTNFRYYLWKHGLGRDWQVGVRYLNVDAEFRLSLIGRSREEIGHLFPVRTRKESGPTDLSSGGRTLLTGDGEWIGGTHWFIRYQEGRVKDILLVKG